MRRGNDSLTRIRPWYWFAIFLVSFACDTGSKDTEKTIVVEDTTTPADSVRYEWGWNLDSENVDSTGAEETGGKSRFEVRAYQFRSGILKIFLDTAPPAWSRGEGRVRHFAGDSIVLTGLTHADRFTYACNQGPGPYPKVGVLRDSVYERSGRPRLLWFLDTANSRIRPVPIDSTFCFIPRPD